MKKLLLALLLCTSPAGAADRYWVGGSANWDNTAGTKWALTSGGAGGQAVPTTSDNVFFDATSGGVTVTLATANGQASNLDFSGFTGSLTGTTGLQVNGNLTLGSAMTIIASAGVVTLGGTSGTQTITSNGKTLDRPLTINGVGATKQLADALVLGSTRTLTLTNGTFNANNQAVTVGNFISSNSNTRVLTLGSGTWTIQATLWNIGTSTGMTLTAGASTIKMTNSTSATRAFLGGGLTYNNFWHAPGAGDGSLGIGDSNTFNDFKDDGTTAHIIAFFSNTTTTVSTFTVSGNPGELISLIPDDVDPFTLSDASGTNNSDYLDIANSTATGGATWNAGANSVDSGGNTGWIFGGGGPTIFPAFVAHSP